MSFELWCKEVIFNEMQKEGKLTRRVWSYWLFVIALVYLVVAVHSITTGLLLSGILTLFFFVPIFLIALWHSDVYTEVCEVEKWASAR